MQSQRVGIGRAFAWFGLGWDCFRSQPAQWIALILLYAVILLALNLLPMVGGLVGTLLSPALGAGLLLAARDGFRGEPVRLGHLFAGLASPSSRGPLLVLGALAIAATLLLASLYLAMVGALPEPGSPPEAVPPPVQSGLGGFFFLVLALLTGLAFYFTAPLVAFTAIGPLTALWASLRASLRNFPTLLLFGLIYAALAIVATIPFGLGLLVLGPVGVGAAYASFAEIFPQAIQGPDESGKGTELLA